MRVSYNVSNNEKTICNDKIQNVKMIYRAAMDVLAEDVSIKYCMQSTLAMGRAAKTSALEQMEQMKKSFQLQFHPQSSNIATQYAESNYKFGYLIIQYK